MAIESNTREIRREISNTRDELGENLNALEDRIKQNWSRAKQKVDPVYQTRQHPWIAVGASVAVGALATSAILSANRRSDEIGDYSGTYPSKPGRTLEFGRRAATSFFDKFGEEIDLIKSIALAAGLRKTGEFVKRNFPAASDAVDRVLESALSKVDSEEQYVGSSSSESGSSQRSDDSRSEGEDRSGEWAFKVSQTRVGTTDFSPYDDGSPPN